MSILNNNISRQNLKASCVAHSLNSSQRQEIGIQSIKGHIPIKHIANRYDVSRKFIYEQKEKAFNGIAQAFEKKEDSDNEVLFYIPVTKKWLEQVLLALIFLCHSSYQGVVEFFRDILDYQISKGTVHNVVYKHLEKAKGINSQQDLSLVKEGLHDEIYQTGDPVLVGCCARSTYCYLLSLEDTCDATTWGVHLLDLAEKQRLSPDFTIIDGGQSARKGQQEAWPGTPARGDVFHALKPFSALIRYLENRSIDAFEEMENIKHRIERPRGKEKQEENQQGLLKKFVEAEEASKKASLLADEITTLYRWLKNDVLSLVGPSYDDRKELLAFIVEQLASREALCRHKIEPVRKYLQNHSDNILEFVPVMESHLYEIAQEFKVSLSDVWAVYQLKGLLQSGKRYWDRYNELRMKLGQKFYWVESLVNKVLEDTVRANSLVENLNSRLRTYFTLRRELGNEYLGFLQFFLNHRRFMRSERPERVGKSPAELLTGEKHGHWLEMLGFELFKRAA